MDALLKVFGDAPTSEVSIATLTINTMIEAKDNLDILQNVVELSCMKTVVKKKAGVPEDVEGMALEMKARGLAIKFLSLLANDCFANQNFDGLAAVFATIPSCMNSLCEGLKILLEPYSDETQKTSVLDQINDYLVCVSLVASSSVSSHSFLLSSETIGVFPKFLSESKLKLNTARIYRALALSKDSLVIVSSNSEHFASLIEALGSSATLVISSMAAPAVGKKVRYTFDEYHTLPSIIPSFIILFLG